MVKSENKSKSKKDRIGIIGGTFGPAHKGHLAISKEALKKFKLKKVVWAITNQNPFKDKKFSTLKQRMMTCKKIIGKNKSIKIKYFEDIIHSNKTSDLIDYLNRNKKYDLFFFNGSRQLDQFS